MPTVEILKSHSVKTLRDEIAKTNAKLDVIKGYSKDMKKAQIIELMMKHKNRFHHIKIAEKTVRAPPLKSETAKKISKPAQQPAQQPTVIAPKKRVAKTAVVIAPKKPAASKFLKQEMISDKEKEISILTKEKKDAIKQNQSKAPAPKIGQIINAKKLPTFKGIQFENYGDDYKGFKYKNEKKLRLQGKIEQDKKRVLLDFFINISLEKGEATKILKDYIKYLIKNQIITPDFIFEVYADPSYAGAKFKGTLDGLVKFYEKHSFKKVGNPAYGNQHMRTTIKDFIAPAVKKEKAKVKKAEPKKETIKNDHANFSRLSIKQDSIYYDDEKQNIEIDLKQFPKDNELYIGILNGYADPKKKRAKKGLPRKVLCEIIQHLLNTDVINKSTLITLEPGDLGLDDKIKGGYDYDKLKSMYESMGFKQVTYNNMGMDIKSFMKWCDSKYGGNFLDKWADK